MAKQPSSGGGFISAVADGLFFGGGNVIAHRAMDAIMGPRVIQHEHVGAPTPVAQVVPNNETPEACVGQVKAFEESLKRIKFMQLISFQAQKMASQNCWTKDKQQFIKEQSTRVIT